MVFYIYYGRFLKTYLGVIIKSALIQAGQKAKDKEGLKQSLLEPRSKYKKLSKTGLGKWLGAKSLPTITSITSIASIALIASITKSNAEVCGKACLRTYWLSHDFWKQSKATTLVRVEQ